MNRWMLLAWPGLAHLWVRGSWAALALAVGFTTLVSVLGISLGIFSEWLPSWLQWSLAAVVATVWLTSATVSLRSGLCRRPGAAAKSRQAGTETIRAGEPDLFRTAQAQYLQGDWLAAEQTLRQMIRRRPRDVEARLLWATLLRHTQRFDEAAQQLEFLERIEQAEVWALEIALEKSFLNRPKPAGQTKSPDQTASPGSTAITDAA